MVSRSPPAATIGLDVVVPSASPLELLRASFPSLAATLAEAGIAADHVVVVDDRPARDGVSGFVASLGFRHVPTPGGMGAGAARNEGAARGKRPWIVFADDDLLFDRAAFAQLLRAVARHPDAVGILGGLRPPRGSPRWLSWTYQDTTLTPASGLAPAGQVPPVAFATGLVAVRRDAYESAGAFPELASWGLEDAVFGVRLKAAGVGGGALWREPAFGAVHLFLPGWEEWLDRREAAGRQLARILPDMTGKEADVLRSAYGMGQGPRGKAKRLAGYVPRPLLRAARGRLLRRLAAAGAEARGYRLATRAGGG